MGSGGSTKSTTNSVTTPNVPDWIQNPYQGFAGQVSQLGSMDPASFTTGASTLQQQGFANAAQGTGGANVVQPAMNATQGLMGYAPQQVTAGQLASTDLSPYMNPWQQSVIDASMADFGQANAVGLNQLRGGTPTGAFNGSRAGVAEGTLTADNVRTQAGLLAGLRSQGFLNAQDAALQDITNRLGADQFNSQQGLAGANFNLNAANQMGLLGLAGANNQRADTEMQLSAGEDQRAIDSQTNPNVALLSLLQAQGGLLGQIPSELFTGQTTNQTTRSSSSPGLLSTLGSIAQLGAGLATGNPFLVASGARTVAG